MGWMKVHGDSGNTYHAGPQHMSLSFIVLFSSESYHARCLQVVLTQRCALPRLAASGEVTSSCGRKTTGDRYLCTDAGAIAPRFDSPSPGHVLEDGIETQAECQEWMA